MSLTIKESVDRLKAALTEDPQYAWAWHCNIAMPIKDAIGCSHQDANIAAARVMSQLFGIDITAMKEYKDIVES